MTVTAGDEDVRHRDGNDDAGDDDADGYGDAAGSDENVNDDVAGEWCHHQLHFGTTCCFLFAMYNWTKQKSEVT